MRRYGALIVDFGGVLTSSLDDSLRACARGFGLAEDTLLRLIRHDRQVRHRMTALERGEIGQPEFAAALSGAAGVPAEGLLDRMGAQLRPDHTMLSAVATLRDTGVRVGVLSNSWGTGPFDPYRGYDLTSRADAVVISDRVGLRKPDPAIFTLTADLLGVPAPDCVFVDDTAVYLSGAQQLGMRVIHHVHTEDTIPALESLFGVRLA